MLGVGGVLAEAIADVVFRPAPLSRIEAAEMIDGWRPRNSWGVPRRGRRQS